MDINEVEEMLSPSEVDEYGQVKPEYSNFNSAKGLTGLIDYAIPATAIVGGAAVLGGGGYGTYKGGKFAKQASSRLLDTKGFGNVSGSYGSPNKFSQALSNLYSAANQNILNMPRELIAVGRSKGIPVELKSAANSIILLEEEMNTLKNQGKKIPSKTIRNYKGLVRDLPDRAIASAIKEKIFKNPINFEYDGNFIENTKPQLYDKDVAKALKDKGFSLKANYDVYNPSEAKTAKMVKFATGDPRMIAINRALKNGNVELAKSYAKNGTIIIGNKIHDTGHPIRLEKVGNKYVATFVPRQHIGGGELIVKKEYVFGGHTQRSHFIPHKGGYHRAVTEGFDITSYASQGEKGASLAQKSRMFLAGEQPRKLGLHKGAVVSEWRFEHPLGRGRKIGQKVKRGYSQSLGHPDAYLQEYIGKKPNAKINPHQSLKGIKSDLNKMYPTLKGLTKRLNKKQVLKLLVRLAIRR